MPGLQALRISFLGAALVLTNPALASTELDDLVKDHVMWRFDEQARRFIHGFGGKFVSSDWRSDTRTLIAFGELDRRLPARAVDVANRSAAPALKRIHVAQICRHSMRALIHRFLEKYDVTIALVYDRRYSRDDSLVVEIGHHDLGTCA